jgi:tetratricopeptide (TPR) repeat protein
VDVQSVLAQGQSLMTAGRYPEAVRALEQVAYHRPDYPDVHNLLGVALSMTGAALRAESHLQRALELNPRYAEAHLNLAILLSERGAYHAARDHLREFDRLAVPADGSLPEAALDDLSKRHFALGQRYRACGLVEEAEGEFRRALRLRPEYRDVRLVLSRLLFERGKLDEAAEQLERVLQQHRNYDQAQLLLGRVELERGRPDAARVAWQQVRVGTAAVQARAWLERLGRDERSSDGARLDGSGAKPRPRSARDASAE